MFFLNAYTQNGELIILHVRGFSDKNKFGMINGEGVFEVKITGKASIHVVRQVGVVQFNENHISFNYTDENFKKSIRYNEETGYSTMDGGLWEVRKTAYIDEQGNTSKEVNPTAYMQFMYNSAKHPFMKIPNLAAFFAPTNKSKENDAVEPNPIINRQKTTVSQLDASLSGGNSLTKWQASALDGFVGFEDLENKNDSPGLSLKK